jgi:hypothetical protein
MSRRPKVPIAVRRQVLYEARHHCAVCCDGLALQFAHIIPWCNTHDHSSENLIALCANCHNRADTEKWGESYLRRYKLNPCILAEPQVPISPEQKAIIDLIIASPPESMTEWQRVRLVSMIAAYAGVKVLDHIQVINVSPANSSRVRISMPLENAHKLIAGFRQGDQELKTYLDNIKLLDVQMVQSIDWRRYLQKLIHQPSLKKIGNLYVPIGVNTAGFVGTRSKRIIRDLPAIVGEDSQIVVLGEPGSGKTWALLHLLLVQADEYLAGGEIAAPLPLYLELRDWDCSPEAAIREPSRFEIFQLLWLNLCRFQSELSQLEASSYHTILEETFENHSFTLIFDGLDEIFHVAQRRRFVYSLIDFLEYFAGLGHNYIVSSRTYGFVGEVSETLIDNDFQILEITKKPDVDVKRKFLKAYLPALPGQVSSDNVLNKLTSNYRLARLSDNALLMNILAEHYKPGVPPPQTRGLLLKKRAESYIAGTKKLPGELAKEFMSRLALEMRDQKRRDLRELQEVIPMIQKVLNEFSVKEVSHHEHFLHLLLSTGLIKRRQAVFNKISFELPQYQEYFLACKVFVELEQKLNEDSKALELPYIKNDEWHHVLILAAGLLDQEDAEHLAGMLDNERHVFLKARVLGEALAPLAEAEFIEALRLKLKRALDRALLGLSRTALGGLALWWLGVFPLAFVLSWLWATNVKLAWAVFVGYLVGIPIILRFIYPRLFQRQVNRIIHRSLPSVLSAWDCLRTGVVEIELRNFRREVSEKMPRGAYKKDLEGDLFVKFVKSVITEIDQALDIVQQENFDAVLNQIEGNPDLIHHWLNKDPKAFSSNEVELLERFLMSPEAQRLKVQLKCVRKLRDAALSQEPLKDQILEVLQKIIVDPHAEPRLLNAAKKAKNVILHQGTKPQWKTIAFCLVLVSSFALLSLLAKRYGAGENFWQRILDFWAFFVIWFASMLVVGQYVLHPASAIREFFRRVIEPKP